MVSKIPQFTDTCYYIYVVSDDHSQSFPFDCKCIGALNFWPRTRLTVNKLKRHIFVRFFHLIHI